MRQIITVLFRSFRLRSAPRPPLTPPPARLLLSAAALLLLAAHAVPSLAQGSSSSSSDGSSRQESGPGAHIAQPQSNGSAITLETSEPLFDLSAALNTCGYDADLSASLPLRNTVRQQVAQAAAATPEATRSREALCTYIRQHTLADPGRNLAQYVSLSLYTSPELTAIAETTELPPDSTQVADILPLLKTFVDQTHLHALWVEHHADYNALVDRIHDPLTRMIEQTNIYLRSPVSTYDGRRFLVLLEPTLAPSAVNARIYGANYIIVVSPSSAGTFHLEQIRHTYLHYLVEPMIYSRASSLDQLLPLLKAVQDAPIEYSYKSDVVALLTECLIKAIEARTMETGLTRPTRPTAVHQRADLEKYDAAMSLYERQNEAARRSAADLATRHGWVLTNYFYNQLVSEEHSGVSLKDNVGQMVYGMDVERQRHAAQQISFIPDPSQELVRRVAPRPTGLRLAEMKMMQGDSEAARTIADTAIADPAGDHSQANYILARIDLLQGKPEDARTHFQAALSGARDPHTVAWSHIYLGRLYDVLPNRKQAVQEYQAALAANDPQPDTRAAANNGLRAPFALPKAAPVAAKPAPEDDSDLDPSGKAEKDAYQPPASK